MFEGRVEVCDEGEWKSVCDSKWGSEEAKLSVDSWVTQINQIVSLS